jgi:ABC-type polysaccharide/polyol phosphate export permease
LASTDSIFILEQLILRDFKIRYRNTSLGVFWCFLNPLIMVGVYTFVVGVVFKNLAIPHYPLFVLCGIICYNYFTLAWTQGTYSLTAHASLLKRVVLRREVIPISSVLANGIHFVMQLGLVLVFTLASGLPITAAWFWLPVPILILVASVCGLALLFSTLDVYLRDTRFIVESVCLVLLWLTPVFYSESMVPAKFRAFYLFNPISAAAVCFRQIVIDHRAPDFEPIQHGLISAGVLLIAGFFVFDGFKKNFGDHL